MKKLVRPARSVGAKSGVVDRMCVCANPGEKTDLTYSGHVLRVYCGKCLLTVRFPKEGSK